MAYLNKKYLLAIIILFALKICGQNLFWIDGVSQKIQSIDFSGANQTTTVNNVGAAFGIASDLKNNKLFWVDNTAKAIKCSDLDGSN